ncbi:MAG: hypothetical protein J6I36_07280 [Bacteroidaceae bacterium]|nr:hypothetical protein [Bacteroidaceae bacterium]
MGFFDNIANKFTEKPGKKLTRCKKCNHLCHGYPVENWSAPLVKKGIRLAGVTMGSVFGIPGGGPIAEGGANKLLDTRLKNGNLIVYEFECDDCGKEFFRLMPDDEDYYVPTEEEESENNKKNRDILKQALDQKWGIYDDE